MEQKFSEFGESDKSLNHGLDQFKHPLSSIYCLAGAC